MSAAHTAGPWDVEADRHNGGKFTIKAGLYYIADTSSGDYSKAASSGYGSTAASSGYGSTAASSGANTIAMVAGLYGQAKAGTNGCIALCWHDGKRNRIVTGYVGEDIDADTLYRVEAGKLVKV